MQPAFYLVLTSNHAYITNPELQVKVYVRDPDNENHLPAEGNLDFYYEHAGKWYCFEAEFPFGSYLENITAALCWYAKYSGWPHSHFQMRDPRKTSEFEIN